MMKLLIGGSPCTFWSIAQTKQRETQASGMGWELFCNFLIARDKYQPDYFLYENNKSMSAAVRAQITKEFGFEPVLINSALVSAQNRQRLYWVGRREPEGTYSQVEVCQPDDRGILLRDILESGVCWREKAFTLKANYRKTSDDSFVDAGHYPAPGAAEPVNVTPEGKAQCLRATCYKDGIRNMVGNNVDRRTCVAEPVRVANIDGGSQGNRIYDADGKSCAVTAHGGGMGGAGQGLYATPIRVGDMPNTEGEISGGQMNRIYSDEGKAVTLMARPNGGGVGGPLYAEPCAGRIVGRRINESGHRDDYNESLEHFQRFEVNENPGRTNCLTTVQKDNMIAEPVIYQTPHGFNAGGIKYDKAPTMTANGDWQHNNFMIEAADGKAYPVYEVRNGLITIKGKTYPIKLRDGFYIIRKLTVTECKRLQTVPDDYVFPVSDTQAYKMLGNGWTVEVIAHIMSHFEGLTEEPVEVLSMYDGMSCGHIALDRLGAKVVRYWATEIDKYAVQTTQENYPETIQLGDAFALREDDWSLEERRTE